MRDNGYTRMVFILKIVLPVLAICILAVSFYYYPLQRQFSELVKGKLPPEVAAHPATDPLGSVLTKRGELVEYYAKKIYLTGAAESSIAEELRVVSHLAFLHKSVEGIHIANPV